MAAARRGANSAGAAASMSKNNRKRGSVKTRKLLWLAKESYQPAKSASAESWLLAGLKWRNMYVSWQ
jgi:hypothetical protein